VIQSLSHDHRRGAVLLIVGMRQPFDRIRQ
jgi:hypothetical protein